MTKDRAQKRLLTATTWLIFGVVVAHAVGNEVIADTGQSRFGNNNSFHVLEPAYWVKEGPTHRLVDWIDDNRVIFVGGPFETWDHNKINAAGIYVFDTRHQAVTKLADGTTYCFKPNEITYTLKRSADAAVIRVIKRNISAPETEIIRTRAEIEAESQKGRERGFKTHPLYCGAYSPRELAGKNLETYGLAQIFPLLDGHGYLDLLGRHPNFREPPFDTEPVRWFPPNGGPPVHMPMPKRAIAQHRIEYSEWNNTYVLRGSGRLPPPDYEVAAKGQRWPTAKPFPVWLLHPNGSIENREVPYSDWIASYGRILLTRAGFAVSRDINTKQAGLYLVVGKNLVKLASGSTIGVTVSPDGCKVAVAITTDFNNRNGGLKVANVCERRGTS